MATGHSQLLRSGGFGAPLELCRAAEFLVALWLWQWFSHFSILFGTGRKIICWSTSSKFWRSIIRHFDGESLHGKLAGESLHGKLAMETSSFGSMIYVLNLMIFHRKLFKLPEGSWPRVAGYTQSSMSSGHLPSCESCKAETSSDMAEVFLVGCGDTW